MNRSVLIVTPFFAPQTHAAVFRAYKLAKYLPRFGWKPYVLTVDHHYHFNEDPSLLEALPPEVEITQARYIEPTLRGLRMALGGRDRSFAALKSQGDPAVAAGPREEASTAGIGQSLYRRLRESWLNVPDAHWTWYRPAVRAGRALIRRHKIPIVFSTCMPPTVHEIGRTLSREEGCRWVADFRDTPSYTWRMFSAIDRVYMKQRKIERNALIEADAVTVTSSSYPLIFRDQHREIARKPIHFIPTGVDTALLPGESSDRGPAEAWPYILFAGEFLNEYGGSFLETFAEALRRPGVRETGIKLMVVGQVGMNRSRLTPWIDRYGLATHVEFRDHMPQGDLYRLLQGAKAGVLIPGREAHWWNMFAKLIDYIGLRIPVLAIVPDPSEARSQLSRAGLGVFLDGDTTTRADTMARFLLGGDPGIAPVPEACDRFLVDHQVRAFAELFEGLLPPDKDSGESGLISPAASYVDPQKAPWTSRIAGREAVAPNRDAVAKC